MRFAFRLWCQENATILHFLHLFEPVTRFVVSVTRFVTLYIVTCDFFRNMGGWNGVADDAGTCWSERFLLIVN
jgi:hypothetical protein